MTATDTTTGQSSAPLAFSVTVNKPAAPTVNPISAQTVTGGQSATFTATATGPAGDALQFSLSSASPTWASIVASTGVVTMQPPASVSGPFTIDVTATDTSTQETSTAQAVSVTVNEPSAPTVGLIPTQIVTAGQIGTFTATATGPVGDTIQFVLMGAPTWATLTAGTGTVILQPPTSVSGPFIFDMTATDTVTKETSIAQPVIVTVNKPGAPAVNAIPVQTVTGGGQDLYTATATAPSGDTVQFSLSNQPSWASIIAATGAITLAPPTSVSGSFTIDVTATDTTAGQTSAALAFSVTVNKPAAPTVNPIPAQAVTGGQSATFTATATGPAGDARYSTASAIPLQHGPRSSPVRASSRCNPPPV